MFCISPLHGTKESARIMVCDAIGLDYEEAAEFFTLATPTNFQTHYNGFVESFPRSAKVISDWRPLGVGPGEMIVYFLFDNVNLGGKNAPIDIYVDGLPFAEMKGGAYCQKRHSLDNFKLSRDQDPSSKYIIQVAENTPPKLRFTVDNQIVSNWKDLIFREYIDGKTMAIIQNDTLRMRHFGPLTKEMVDLHCIYRNQPWARVLLPKE